MSNRTECRDYFKGQRAFARCFERMRDKWESYGRADGKIRVTLADASKEERTALGRFLGRSFPDGTVSFTLKEFERNLQESRFAPVTLPELLSDYFGEELTTKRARRQQNIVERDAFFAAYEQHFAKRNAPAVSGWIHGMAQEKRFGYALLNREREKDRVQAGRLLEQVGECIRMLQEPGCAPIHLAVLAARVTKNPHCFDRGQLAGALLSQALAFLSGCEAPKNARELAGLYFAHGIQMDDISSTVAVFGLHLETEKGRHPAYEGFWQEREACILSMANLTKICRAYGDTGRVFVVENEMVFSHLLDRLKKLPLTLLCTSGQPRTAALLLLDLLMREKTEVYYAGDLDPEGLEIAERLRKRYGENFHIWRMGPEEYRRSMSEEPVEQRRLSKLSKLEQPCLVETAKLLWERRLAGYQERLLAELEEDIRKGIPV